MATTEQKTEYWLIGTLRIFIQCGMLNNFRIKRESILEEDRVDWWELDETFKSWADQRVFMEKASELLDKLGPRHKMVVTQHLAAFTNLNCRHLMLQQAYQMLLNKS